MEMQTEYVQKVNRGVLGVDKKDGDLFWRIDECGMVLPSYPSVYLRMRSDLWQYLCGVKACELWHKTNDFVKETFDTQVEGINVLQKRLIITMQLRLGDNLYGVEIDDTIPTKSDLNPNDPWQTCQTTKIVYLREGKIIGELEGIRLP